MDVKLSLLTVTLVLFGDVVTSQKVTVDFTADQVANITEGGQILLTCKVSGLFNDGNDTLIIKKGDEVSSVRIASEEGTDAGAPQNVQFVSWLPGNNEYILYVSISDIGRADRGKYMCEALRQQGINSYETLAQQTVTIDVLFSPSGRPSCKASPTKTGLTYHDGDKITLQCISDAGNPQVPVQWSSEDKIRSMLKPEIRKSQDNIVSSLFLTLTTDFDGVTFNCSRQNDNDTESCFLGPITVLNKTVLTPYTEVTDEPTQDWLIPVIVVAGIVALFIIIIFLIWFQRCKSPVKKKKKISKADIALQITIDYKKLPADDNHEKISSDQHGTTATDGKVQPSVQKSKSKKKTYPDPPTYPRPPKNITLDGEKPYENAEIGSPVIIKGTDSEFKYPEETQISASPKEYLPAPIEASPSPGEDSNTP